MLRTADNIREVRGLDAGALPDELLTSTEPVVLRGLVSHWPVVRAALESDQAALRYMLGFCRDAAVVALLGPPRIQGRFFYNEDLTGFNFSSERRRLDAVLNDLGQPAGGTPGGSLYVGSTTLTAALPGFHEQNHVDLGPRKPLISIWLGNRSRIAAHNDLPDNLACVAAGHRRFTLFPPEQLANLYIGPLDFNPAGQPISMVDFANPDYARYPRFAQADRRRLSGRVPRWPRGRCECWLRRGCSRAGGHGRGARSIASTVSRRLWPGPFSSPTNATSIPRCASGWRTPGSST